MLITVAAVIIVVASVINLLHWSILRHRLVYWPNGVLGILTNGLSIVLPVLAIAVLAGFNVMPLFYVVGGSLAFVVDSCSVVRRQQIAGHNVTTAA